jgi:ribonuclease D
MHSKKEIPIEYVDDQQKLQHCEKHLSEASEFSFDLEFDNNHYSYGINLCLIQISTAERCFVIDTLQPLDLSGLFRIFENKAIQKICFSPDQDLLLLSSLNCKPQNIFDVAVAAKLLNTSSSGLGSVLESKLQVTLDKKLQKSNWSKRPLSKEQIEYSANDVMHLITLRNMFRAEAEQKGILDWLTEENEFLDSISPEIKEQDDFLNRKDKESFSEHTLFALNELLKYAHALGKKINKPVGWLINKQILIDLIRDRLSFQEMTGLRGIHPSFKSPDFKEHFDKVLRETENKGLSRKSPNPKPTFEQQQEKLRQKALAETIKANTFYPIKKVISERHGEFAAEFIFGESHINQLISGKIRMQGLKMKYRIELINSVARELGIELKSYC